MINKTSIGIFNLNRNQCGFVKRSVPGIEYIENNMEILLDGP
jgi:hypothetical protein